MGYRDQDQKRNVKNLSGQVFGRLTVISLTKGGTKKSVVWECECSCGRKRKVLSTHLLNGSVESCGYCHRGRMKDLRGQTFGRLRAISPTKERVDGCVVWECECSCGKRKKVSSTSLIRELVKSCGCYQKGRMKDLSGQTFGQLRAISPTKERVNGQVVWECECSCGKRKKVSSAYLTRGRVKNCGCYPTRKLKDLSGFTFGRLRVISPTKERVNGHIVWECECSCGEKKKVTSRNLLNSATRSCGCLRRERASRHMKKVNMDRGRT